MTKEEKSSIISEVASIVGTRPEWLDALINFETGGTYDPLVKNPRSSARGLIQVTDTTAQDIFEYPDSLSLVKAFPTFELQMKNVVLPYLMQRARVYNNNAPLNTQQALYMAVFYPAYINENPSKEFPARVQRDNPGIITPMDYMNFVNARIRGASLIVSKQVPLLLILAAGVAIWYLLARNRYSR